MNIATIFMGGQAAVPELVEALPDATEVGFDAALFQAQLAILGPPGESPPELVAMTNIGVEEFVEGPIAPRIEPDDSESAAPTEAIDWLEALLTWNSGWAPSSTQPAPSVPVPTVSLPAQPVATVSEAVGLRPASSLDLQLPASPGIPLSGKPCVTDAVDARAADPLIVVAGTVQKDVRQVLPSGVVRELNPTHLEVAVPATQSESELEVKNDVLLSHARPDSVEKPEPSKSPARVTETKIDATRKAVGIPPIAAPPVKLESDAELPTEPVKESAAAGVQLPPRKSSQADADSAESGGHQPDLEKSGLKESQGKMTVLSGDEPESEPVEPSSKTEPPEIRLQPAAAPKHVQAAARATGDMELDAPTREMVVQRAAEAIDRLLESRPFGQVKIQLHPEDLGSITVTVRTMGQRVEAEIMASNESVRSALENSKPLLAPAVEAKGLQFGNLTIQNPNASSWTDGQYRQPDPQAHQQFQQMVGERLTRHDAEPTPPGSNRWATLSGRLDLTI